MGGELHQILDSTLKAFIIIRPKIYKTLITGGIHMTCTKTTIIEKIIDEQDFKPADAKDVIEAMLKIIKSTLASGEDIMISGFGKFQVTEKEQRKGRNPATGEAMTLDKRKVVNFKCSGKLRDQINQNHNMNP